MTVHAGTQARARATESEPEPPPARTDIEIDSPRFSCIKRDDRGAIDFVSPLPCPFNYGSVPGTRSCDGDRIDALLLGPRRPRGLVRQVAVVGVVRFIDAGQRDPKWICSARPLDLAGHTQVDVFFRLYALLKRALNRARGKLGETRYDGIELCTGTEPDPLRTRPSPSPGTKPPVHLQ